MKNYKISNLLSTNQQEIKAAIFILETNKKEGEEFVFFQYKTNDQANDLLKLKGVILASVGISHGILGNDYEIMIVEDTSTRDKIQEASIKYNLNNNKALIKQDLEYNAKYKICSKSFLKNYLISVILPSSVPDNCITYICNELIEDISCFFENFATEETRKLYSDFLFKFCDNVIYNTLIYSISPEKEDFLSSPILNPALCCISYNYNNQFPCFIVKPPITDMTKSELIEIVNTINSDRSVLQETLTLMDPPIFLRGCTLMFKGYVIYSSLSNSELENLYRLGSIYELSERNCSSPEVLVCEYLYVNNNISFNDEETTIIESNHNNNNTNLNFNGFNEIEGNNKFRKTILCTILAQRDFVIYCYLDILNTKLNSSFDPFYHKRVEDLLIGLIKKSYQNNINNELAMFGISLNDNYKSINESNRNTSTKSKTVKHPNINSSFIATSNSVNNNNNNNFKPSRIKGIIDIETNVNMIHYSLYNDSERVINTTDLNIDPITLQEIYRVIFNKYALIQSNINKLNQRKKKLRISESFNYSNSCNYYLTSLKLDNKNKMKIIKDNFLREVFELKSLEMGVKLKLKNLETIWVVCKIYEHGNIIDEFSPEQFSNYKTVFLAYESENLVDVDNFCQDLIINELFI